MNNKRIGKFAVTAIVGVLSAISGIVGIEMMKNIKKETEKAGDEKWGTKKRQENLQGMRSSQYSRWDDSGKTGCILKRVMCRIISL